MDSNDAQRIHVQAEPAEQHKLRGLHSQAAELVPAETLVNDPLKFGRIQSISSLIFSGKRSNQPWSPSIWTCVWRPSRLSETKCATLSDFPLFAGA